MPSFTSPARFFFPGVLWGSLFLIVFNFGCSAEPEPSPPPPFRVGVLLDKTPLSRSLELGLTMAFSEIQLSSLGGGRSLELDFFSHTTDAPFPNLTAVITAPGLLSQVFEIGLERYPLLLVPAPPSFLFPLSAPTSSSAPLFPTLPVTLQELKEVPILFLGTSQEVEVIVSARFFNEIFPSLREIVVIYPSTPWGVSMFSAFSRSIPIPGPIVRPLTYPAELTQSPPFDPGEFADAVTPLALYILGASEEVIPQFFSTLDGKLPPSTILLLSSTCGEPELFPPSPISPGNTFRIAPVPATTIEGKLFATTFQNRYGSELDLGAAYGYDTLFLLALSLTSPKSMTSQERWEEILAMAHPPSQEGVHILFPLDFRLGVQYVEKGERINYEGVSGAFYFEPTGERRDGYFTFYNGKEEGGKLKFTPWETRAVQVPRAR